MIPDLRFIIGAVMATALLGATVLGLAAAMHISYQSKLSSLEASRLLAYSSDSRPRISVSSSPLDNPFANIPVDPNPVPMQQPAVTKPEQASLQPMAEPLDPDPAPARQESQPNEPPVTTAAQVQPATDPEPATLSPPVDDPDMVDERVVVDPPLPPDGVPASLAEAEPAVAAPASVAPPEPPAAAAPPIETSAPVEMSAAPIETTPAEPTPAIASPSEPVAPTNVDTVGSIPARHDAAATRSDSPAADPVPDVSEEPAKAKRKRAARKGAVRPARPLRRAAILSDPFNSTGYYPIPTPSTANRPAKGFWSID